MTRGTPRRLDYNFLGQPPPELWWQPLGDNELVVLEQPEVIAYGDGAELSMLVSGVPSQRRDIIGTLIRYTLVIDHLQADVDLAQRLAATGLSPGGRTRLGRRLDQTFDAAMVDGLLSGSGDDTGVGELLADVLASPDWSTQVTGSGREIRGSWAAPAASSDACAAFIARIGKLAAGDRGFAFTSHSLTTEHGAEQAVAELPGSNAVLLADSELEGVVRLGKVPAEAPPKRRGRLLLVAAVAVAAAAITVLALVLT
jgi:hypothetical protein